MLYPALILFLLTIVVAPDRSLAPSQPLAPTWSPDHKVLATTKVPQAFVTPEGGNYRLLLNGSLTYPRKAKRAWFSAYENQHTFLSPLEWSPDSRHVAFVEKIYDWEYTDPYNRYFDGRVSNLHFYLAVVSLDGQASGYQLDHVPLNIQLEWKQADEISFNGRSFDLRNDVFKPIP